MKSFLQDMPFRRSPRVYLAIKLAVLVLAVLLAVAARPAILLRRGVEKIMTRERLYLYDTTLRDGAQTQGVDFSLEDKALIAQQLDVLGIDYIEAGYPGANPDRHQAVRRAADGSASPRSPPSA